MKKNNKGFTLIELLAVIVVLAIIALITVPQVLGFTDSARKGSVKTSALNYIDAVEKQYAEDMLEGNNSNFESPTGGYGASYLNNIINTKGKLPTCGKVEMEKDGVVKYILIFDNKYIVSSFSLSCYEECHDTESPSTCENVTCVTEEPSISEIVNEEKSYHCENDRLKFPKMWE